MAFRRKRRAKVVWLPPAAENRVGINPAVAGINPGAGTFVIDGVGLTTPGLLVQGYSALISDISSGAFQGSAAPLETLADIYSSGYRLRRIVGKLYVGVRQGDGTVLGDVPEVLVTAGIIVLRTDPTGNPLSTLPTYDPQMINQWADPWVWRRTWLMSNLAEAIAAGIEIWPENNAQYGSVMDGPHVDAKTARVLGREERLFLVASILTTRGAANGDVSVRFTWDLRFVASMRTQQGNRFNASR